MHKKSAFTLVELIVVITILAILGTIAFLSFNGYSSSARDSTRVSDLASIAKTLDVYQVNTGKYPLPDNYLTTTYSGGIVWYQGTVWLWVFTKMTGVARGGISAKPTDPVSGKEYRYASLEYSRHYQLQTELESTLSYYPSTIIDTAYADTVTPGYTYIKGNYNGLVARTQTGNTIYLVATPSILTSSGSSGSILDITTLSGTFLYNNQPTDSWIAFTPVHVFSGTSLPVDDTSSGITNLVTAIQQVYTGSQIPTDDISSIFTITGSSTIPSWCGILSGVWGKCGGALVSVSEGGGEKIDGACGTSSGWIFMTIPSSNLCATWMTGSVSLKQSGGWSWDCTGSNGGTDAVCSAIDNSLVWYWNLDTNLNDTSGKNHHLTSIGGSITTWNNRARLWKSTLFTSSAYSDTLWARESAYSSDFDIGTGFTVVTWLRKHSSTVDTEHIIMGNRDIWNDAKWWRLTFPTNEKIAFTVQSTTSTSNWIYATSPLAVGWWYQVAWVYDSGTMKLYINGILEGQKSGVSYTTTSLPLALWWRAHSSWWYDYGFNWLIDETKIYKRALADTEIQNLYDALKPTIIDPTLGTIWNPAPTCKDILANGMEGNGYYYVKPTSNPAFSAFCDMITSNGWWTHIIKNDSLPSSSIFTNLGAPSFNVWSIRLWATYLTWAMSTEYTLPAGITTLNVSCRTYAPQNIGSLVDAGSSTWALGVMGSSWDNNPPYQTHSFSNPTKFKMKVDGWCQWWADGTCWSWLECNSAAFR